MSFSRFRRLASRLLFSAVLLSCLQLLPAQTIQEKDAGGTLVTVSRPPVRIVSLTLYSDEVLFSLVDSSRIAAFSSFAADPHLSNLPAGASAGKVLTDLNVEYLIGLKPDLVLVADWSDAAKVALLRRAGLTVFVLPTPSGIEGMKAGLALIGRLCQAPEKAAKMIADVDARLAAVAAALRKDPGRKALIALDYNSWGSANGKGSTWDDLLVRAGLENGAAAWPAGPFAQVSISREMIITLNPDLVFVPDWVYGSAKDAGDFLDSVRQDAVLAHLKAWKNGGIKIMPERLKSTVSQYMVDAVEFLASSAWPRLFPAAAGVRR